MIDGPGGTQYLAFNGWEVLRLGGGWDLRFSRWFGLGAFTGASLGTYGNVTSDGPHYFDPGAFGSQRLHVWLQLGVRAILFP